VLNREPPQLLAALVDVASGLVAYHPIWEAHGDRYGWRPNGEMPQALDNLLHLAHDRHLIHECRDGMDFTVVLTAEGAHLLNTTDRRKQA
jgi:hypothetical protein